MEDNFRNALIILSGVVIAAIFIHGLWTIRKQKNPYKLKASKEKVKPLTRDFDGKGFDQDGVGQVKVVKQNNEANNEAEVDKNQNFELSISIDEMSNTDTKQGNKANSVNTSLEQVSEVGNEKPAPTSDTRKEIILEKPVYQQPVTQAKPVAKKVAKKATKIKPNLKAEQNHEIKSEPTKRPQIEINFGDGLALDNEPEPNININESKEQKVQKKQKVQKESQKNQKEQLKENIQTDNPANKPQIIILSVVMPMHQQMSGAALLPSLLTLGLKYGEMNIFHRHQDSAGNGAVTFSLANMLNPGSFDLDTMETFVTQGVSLFMVLPNATDPFAAFDQMLAAAKQLASEFNAQLVDDKRNIMTKQTEQHYVGKIREFDRQYRLASVE